MIRALARAAVDNPVTVNLATLTLAAAGLLAYFSMPREVFPNFALGSITVTTLYPGAAPEDVERLVTLPIEDQLQAELDEAGALIRGVLQYVIRNLVVYIIQI